MRPITARPARFRQKHCKPYTLCKALYHHGPPLAGDGAGVLHSDCRESDRERKSKSNGSSPEEEAEPMSKAKSFSYRIHQPQQIPTPRPRGGTTENHSQQREGRARRAIACDERRCADALNRLDSDERTLVSIEGVSNGKPSIEAEPMRGRTSTPAAGRQGTGKGDEDAAPSCGPVSP